MLTMGEDCRETLGPFRKLGSVQRNPTTVR